MMTSNSAIETAQAAALARWQTPFAGFATGHDPRTRDQGLLAVLHGSLAHAAHYDWLNAGRRLVDKTYIDMLWHAQRLTPLRAVRPEQVAAALDGFIATTIRPRWDELPRLDDNGRRDLAVNWVEQMAGECFGSIHSELAASRLAFFLLPMLPVFNLSGGHLAAVDSLGKPAASSGYRAYADAAETLFADLQPALQALPLPQVDIADARQSAIISNLLADGDWWQRRVFDAWLQQHATTLGLDIDVAFACSDAGQPVVHALGE